MISSLISIEPSRRLIGSRGSRRSAGVPSTPVPVPPAPERPTPVPVREVAPTPPAPLGDGWPGTLVHTLRTFLHRLRAAPERPREAPAHAPSPATLPVPAEAGERPRVEGSFERGLREIHRTDPGFDPTRFKGYAGMIFRAAQAAWMTRDMAPLRDRFTPEMHDALQAQCDRLRSSGRVNRIDEIEITATVTEAWQESGRDYVTAHLSGSIIDYTVDEARDVVVDGSKTVPRDVEEFWTFTRPAGLNFWMISAIQT